MIKFKYESTVTPIKVVLDKAKDLFATNANVFAFHDLVRYMFLTWCGISESELNGLGITNRLYEGDWVELGIGYNIKASVGIAITLVKGDNYVELRVSTPSTNAEKQAYAKYLPGCSSYYTNEIRNGKQFRSVIRKWLQWAQGQVQMRFESVNHERSQLMDAKESIFEALKKNV